MLVKVHTRDYSEDHGWLHEDVGILNTDTVNFLSRGNTKITEAMRDKISRVASIHWMWLEQDIHVHCKIAATREEKVVGLQSHMGLRTNEGLYFPYPGGSDVCFHQGSVKFPLDIIFLRDDEVVHYVENTRVGSTDTWACKDCDGVIEVNAGFVEDHGVDFGDELTFFAHSEQDQMDYQQEQIEYSQVLGAIANELV